MKILSLFLICLFLPNYANATRPLPKVTICHVPPGNPNNPRTIQVDPSAVPWHLANHEGDYIGPCTPKPTVSPTPRPTWPTNIPTSAPSKSPTDVPTVSPSNNPTNTPTDNPSFSPTKWPTD